jgi:hypothetical protein
MKRFGLLILLFSMTSAAFGQVGTGVSITPVAFGFSNSVVDLNGNVLIFDESFPLAAPAGADAPTSLSLQTHVIVVSADGKTVTGSNYTGTFQILGVGQNGVYASVNTFTFGTASGTTTAIPIFSRQLVVLHVVAGTLPATLPSVTVASNQEAKLSLAVGTGQPDTIALVSGNTFILPPILATTLGATSPVASTPHMVWLYTCDGLKFTPNANNPISTAGK